jgi:hypothetical protein
MIETITSFLISYSVEIGCSGVFIAGVGAYTYFKKQSKKEHKLVFYNITDRIVKAKKTQQVISDRVGGGSSKNGAFFKAS